MTNRTTQDQDSEQSKDQWSLEHDADVWRIFVSARNDEEFYQSWLALLCRQLTGVKTGVVLVQSAEAHTFVPVAVWPLVSRDLSALGQVAERALAEGRGVTHRNDDTPTSSVQIAYPIEVSNRILGSVVLELTPRSDGEVREIFRQLHWGVAWLHDRTRRREMAALEAKNNRIGSVMEVLATALAKARLQQCLFDVANHVAQHLRCSRVVIGLASDRRIRVVAFSNAAWFEKNTALVKLYAAAMEEAYDQSSPYHFQAQSTKSHESNSEPTTAHGRLARDGGAKSLLSVPLTWGAECLGVITFERNNPEPFSADDSTWIDALVGLLPAIIQQKQRAERGLFAHFRDAAGVLGTRLFGPRHLTWKFVSSLLGIVLAALLVLEIDYRVAAKTVIEGEIQRAIVAPFPSFVAVSHVRPGDTVRQGQVLCELDDNELRLEQHKWKSSLGQNTQKLREAMAKHDLAAFQVLNAQVQETEAQLALVHERLGRSKIAAPFDGVVISGDLSQLIGSPVEQGKKLFEIAPLEAYRVILQVDERDISHVRIGQTGRLVISGLAGKPITLTVSKVTPVATAQDGRNYFRVEARLQQAPPHLRPGMEGIGKITVGERRLWWVLTHTFTDWLRVWLWTYLP